MLRRLLVLFVAAASGLAIPSYSRAAETPDSEQSLIRYLPSGALGTVEISGLAPLIERVENSAALKAYLDSPLYDDALKADPVRKAAAGKAIVEAQLGMSLWTVAKTYLGDRIALGVYPPAGGSQPDGVLVLRVKDAADLTRLIEKLSPLISLAGNQVSIGDHDGGGKSLKFKDGHVAVLKDRWFVLSKNRDLTSQTLTNLASSRDGGLVGETA